jgi:hypothetical protein
MGRGCVGSTGVRIDAASLGNCQFTGSAPIAGATAGSASNELLHQSAHFRDVQELAGPRHAHCLILLPIEVPGRRVHRDDEFGARDQRVLQKTVVRFVPDDAEVGQRIVDGEALDNFSDEFRTSDEARRTEVD